MQIAVNFDFAKFFDRTDKGIKRMAYVVANAINNTAKKVQEAEVERVQKEFTVRKPGFVLRQAAIIKPFANVRQGRPYAEVSVGQKPRLLLGTFEQGGEKKPFKGKRVAVPITGEKARPVFGTPVVPQFTFKQMKFKKHVTTPGKKVQWKGQNRTFILSKYGVFLRHGPKQKDIEMLWAFAKQPPELKAQLKFIETAKTVIDRELHEEIQKAIIKELR